MQHYEAQVLFRPESEALRFLPEGPTPCGPNRFSWVAIQHGPDATTGSLNVFDLTAGRNESYEMEGRPGFAYPTDRPYVFLVGIERRLRLFDTQSRAWTDLAGPVDADVTGTIINDGLVFDEGILFGCKDIAIAEPKAGLYLWRRGDRQLIRLRSDQMCSNGKVIYRDAGQTMLLDIDSPTQTVVAYPLDVPAGRLGEPRVLVDIRGESTFPDGMVPTPDGRGIIVAMYNPGEIPYGEARQYRIADGQLESVWRTPGSPQVTCPLFLSIDDRVKLLLTTAAEHMTPDRKSRHPNAGSLFLADTPFDRLDEPPVFQVPKESD